MIPNILTTMRLFLVPFFAYFMLTSNGTNNNMVIAVIIFLFSGITDIVDGYIARKYNMITDFGKIYDPFVDKLMQITALVCLVIKGLIPIWLLVLVIIKEVTMIIVGGVLYTKKIVVSSNWYGKLSTVVFYSIVVIIILFNKAIPNWGMISLIVIMVISMLVSAGGYAYDTLKNYKKKINSSDK